MNWNVEAKTERIADFLCILADHNGFKWNAGNSFIENTRWSLYRENTFYLFTKGLYGSLYREGENVQEYLSFLSQIRFKLNKNKKQIIYGLDS